MQKFVPGSLNGLSGRKGVSADNFKAGFVAATQPKVAPPKKTQEQKKNTTELNVDNKNFKPVESPKPEEPKPEKPKEKTYLEKDLQESRTKGYEDGYSKGYAAAKQDSDDVNKNILESLKAIEAQLTRINVEKQTQDAKMAKNVSDLSYKIAKKISDISLSENHLNEVENAISKTLQILFSEPKITVNVNATVAEDVIKKVDSIKSTSGFTGEIQVSPDANLTIGSCNIAWQNGGAVHDKQEIWEQINKIIETSIGHKSEPNKEAEPA